MLNDTKIRHWVLTDEEIAFIHAKFADNRYAKNKLAFAIMLKYFLENYRYPNNDNGVSSKNIKFIAEQLESSTFNNLHDFNWSSRTVSRYKQAIRDYLGYREPSEQDKGRLLRHLLSDVIPNGSDTHQSIEHAYEFLSKNKVEPFQPKVIERIVKSAHSQFQDTLFKRIYARLNRQSIAAINHLMAENERKVDKNKPIPMGEIKYKHLKKDMGGIKLTTIQNEINKLTLLRSIKLPENILSGISRRLLTRLYRWVSNESPAVLDKYKTQTKYSLLVIFLYFKRQAIADALTESLLILIHKIKTSSEKQINKQIVSNVKKVGGKFNILFTLADLSLNHPEGVIEDTIYPEVPEGTLQELSDELKYSGRWYEDQVKQKMRSSYGQFQRRVIMPILQSLAFKANNQSYSELLLAIKFIKENTQETGKYYANFDNDALNAVTAKWEPFVLEQTNMKDALQVNRINFELAILEQLRIHLKCKSIWVFDSYKYRNPDDDLPQDFDQNKKKYYRMLDLPEDPKEFISDVQSAMQKCLSELNANIPGNDKVKILSNNGGRIKITPYEPQEEPKNLILLQQEIMKRWSTTGLIDFLKEVDLNINFTDQFHNVGMRDAIPPTDLRKRLLLSLFGLGSNIGLKRVVSGNKDVLHSELQYVKRKYITIENIRNAIRKVVNKIIKIRKTEVWGDATTGCACDSTKISAWDQNLMTEWHTRYQGRGVMIYWHVDRKSLCIYSQLKTCSSSEVGSMIEGVIRHCTSMMMNKTYTDTHGQNHVGFGFSKLLHFDLLPRIKGINKQKLYAPHKGDKHKYENIQDVMKGTIDWRLIEQQYDDMVRYTAALKMGTAETDVILKRFSQENHNHPVYMALLELGKAIKTIFICRYLMSEELRIEINESLNVVERLNGVMDFIFYGKLGEISSNQKDEQQLSILCLHLLQACLVYVNTLMIQEILSEPGWLDKLELEDKRALTPLIHGHINPYGLISLDLEQRIGILGG